MVGQLIDTHAEQYALSTHPGTPGVPNSIRPGLDQDQMLLAAGYSLQQLFRGRHQKLQRPARRLGTASNRGSFR